MHIATAETLFPLINTSSQSPSPLWRALCRCGIQKLRELAGLASIVVMQVGVEPGTLGSSGITVRNWSSCSLNYAS